MTAAVAAGAVRLRYSAARWPRGSHATSPGRPFRYVLLWTAFLGATAAVVSAQDVPTAIHSAPLAAAAVTTSTIVGLALVHLSTLRFRGLGQPIDLLVGAAFATLAAAHLSARLLIPVGWGEEQRLATYLLLLSASRALATGLFLAGLRTVRQEVAPRLRAQYALLMAGGAVAMITVMTVAALVGASRVWPVGPAGLRTLMFHAPVAGVLADQAPWLPVLNAILAGLVMVAASGYTRVGYERDDAHFRWLGLALTLVAFGQVHTLLFPPVTPDYVSTADAFRVTAYLVLLFSLVARIGGDIAQRVTDEERLRLSRELHDGLAQELSLLHMRVCQAAERDQPPERRERLLAHVERLAQAAMLEARQAISALRTGAVTWPELVATLSTFADELAENHEVRVRVREAEVGSVLRQEGGHGQPVLKWWRAVLAWTRARASIAVSADLQAEMLRIVQEASHNAVRHGAATEIEVTIAAGPGALALRVRDNGCGFDPAHVPVPREGGLGLRSLQERVDRRAGTVTLDTAPGRGVSLTVFLPLTEA